jgi:hypothetical protein
MKKIVPFKKDIVFKTQLSEITSISLEHTLHPMEYNLISGEFIVSGEYRIATSSVNTDAFSFNLPFDINVDSKYIIDNIAVDIDDFYYEIVDDSILSINIDVSLDNLKEKSLIDEIKDSPLIINEMTTSLDDVFEIHDFEDKVEYREEGDKMEEKTINSEQIVSLFDNLDDSNESFVAYHVHIVRTGDNLDSILVKYNVSKEELSNYNDLTELVLGAKLIIPTSNAKS